MARTGLSWAWRGEQEEGSTSEIIVIIILTARQFTTITNYSFIQSWHVTPSDANQTAPLAPTHLYMVSVYSEDVDRRGNVYLQNGLKVEREPVPQSELSTRGSGDQTSTFRSPLDTDRKHAGRTSEPHSTHTAADTSTLDLLDRRWERSFLPWSQTRDIWLCWWRFGQIWWWRRSSGCSTCPQEERAEAQTHKLPLIIWFLCVDQNH